MIDKDVPSDQVLPVGEGNGDNEEGHASNREEGRDTEVRSSDLAHDELGDQKSDEVIEECKDKATDGTSEGEDVHSSSLQTKLIERRAAAQEWLGQKHRHTRATAHPKRWGASHQLTTKPHPT